MRIAVVGATGQVGRPLVAELVDRGHRVTAVTIHPELVAPDAAVAVVAADANDPAQLVDAIAGHDVVVTSIQYAKTDHAGLIASVKASGVPRHFVCGGSGTLRVPGTTTRIMDTESFPASFAASAAAAAHFWELLEQETELNWVYLSPPPGIGPGTRTGAYRRGGRELLVREDGAMPSISFADYILAIADELEEPSLVRDRFTVAY
ncbi:NAD(P)H-binding protein [Nocardioides sp. LHD-245]|uniref:NAD(P)-dependent oxidoreductase n=1 Tax=Nocardioides sp. LHD-245 TaxID=3051387 RepID=UPI0027E0094F|nr:NAD(P)H-binding protein [Nocardioides sp. LHD-245]